MMKINKHIVKQVLTILLWLCIGSGITMLLISAVTKEQKNLCKEVVVEFDDQLPFRMLDEDEIVYTLWPATRLFSTLCIPPIFKLRPVIIQPGPTTLY